MAEQCLDDFEMHVYVCRSIDALRCITAAVHETEQRVMHAAWQHVKPVGPRSHRVSQLALLQMRCSHVFGYVSFIDTALQPDTSAGGSESVRSMMVLMYVPWNAEL